MPVILPTPSTPSDPRIGARDLVDAYLDLWGLSREIDTWTEEAQASNPPRLIRLRRLMAMFNAFDLAWDPEGFPRGEFLNESKADYSGFIAKIRAEMPDLLSREGKQGSFDLSRCFQALFGYRYRLQQVLGFSDGVLEVSGASLYALLKIREANTVVKGVVGPIEDMLADLIDPTGRRYSVEALVRDYGYPEDDLDAIDDAWV
jgi:hypothetical protein